MNKELNNLNLYLNKIVNIQIKINYLKLKILIIKPQKTITLVYNASL